MRLRPYHFVVALIACDGGAPTDAPGDAGDATVDASPLADGDTRDAASDAASGLDAARPPEVCARPAAAPRPGDANGDGALDVGDAVALQDHLFRGGRAPVCLAAADVTEDGRVEADDAMHLNLHLMSGLQTLPALADGACDDAVAWPAADCAPLTVQIRAPARVTAELFDAEVVVGSPVLTVRGWSLSLRADGCAITGATTAGTAAAEVWDDPPGLRHLGYSATVVVEGGAVTYTQLSLTEDVALPAAPTAVARLRVQATVPDAGCEACRLVAGDDLAWTGEPVATVVAADGRAFRPDPPSVAIEVCAP